MGALLSILVVAFEFAARLGLIAFILLRGRGRPSTRLTWIVVILAVPLAGAVLYLFVGEARLGARRSRRYASLNATIEEAERQAARESPPPPVAVPEPYEQIAVFAEAVGHCLPRSGNDLQLVGDSDEFVAALVRDIDAARQHCHVLTYIYLDDTSGRRVAAALQQAADRGVACRLLVDGVGSRPFLRSRLRRELQAAGVKVVESLPTNVIRLAFARLDLRNHRKIAVIDGTVAWMGSQNVADAAFTPKPRYAPWVDAMVRIEGPAARDLQRLFVVDWYVDTDEPTPGNLDVRPAPVPDGVPAQVIGTGPGFYNEGLRYLLSMAIFTAREEIILTTPYFVPDDDTASAILIAARRGVRTVLVLPARNDSRLVAAASRSFYRPLLDVGVEIHEFQEGLLHAKTLTLDRSFALVTSGNLDRRSFDLNLEASLAVYDSDFASRLRFLQMSYIDRSRRIESGAWSRRSWHRRLAQNAAGLLAPLL